MCIAFFTEQVGSHPNVRLWFLGGAHVHERTAPAGPLRLEEVDDGVEDAALEVRRREAQALGHDQA